MIGHGSSDSLRKGKYVNRGRTAPFTLEAAEQLAIQALSFVAGDPERLGRFLAMSGIGPSQIRAAAHEPGFLAGILDYLCSDDRLILDFAAQSGFEPALVETARAILAPPAWEPEST
jgi:hypothetical protein